ncbi:ArnT family glycosyltransferase [Kushneria aurantia]|uniref:Glycosyltransferase family 39 protein n=1 Tax=Kushneria aurantia TaxID=504092 RepID=A0ABV6G4E0_9GAMM|nr:glycosyltransferase family 39 protein [Kushneria aurantia]
MSSPPLYRLIDRLQRAPLLPVLLIGLLVLGFGIGWRWPWPADEPRFALIAREMIATHQWLIPHRAGELYPDKPPIFMWAIALGILLTGSLKIAFLLPSLLGGLATLGLTTDLARRLYGPRIAWLAGLTLLLTVQFTLQSRTAQIDMLVTGFITLGAYGALRHALLGPAPGWWYLSCVSMGLGVITKGVGFLPLLLLPAWYGLAAWQRRHPGDHWRLAPLTLKQLGIGLALLLAAIASWVVPMVLYTSFSGDPALAAYRNNILFQQTGERYADSWHHLEPFWYYLLKVLPWAWLPGMLALPWVVPHWFRRLRRADPRLWLPLSFVVLMVLFFSLSPGKRGVYMTPGAALFVLSLAPALPGLIRRSGVRRLCWALIVALGGTIGVTGALFATGLLDPASLEDSFSRSPWYWWLTLGAATAVIAVVLPPSKGVRALAVWFVVFWALWSSWGYAVMDDHRSRHGLMAEVARVTHGAPLALLDFSEVTALQTRQPIVQFGHDTDLNGAQLDRAVAWLREAPGQRWAQTTAHQARKFACLDQNRLIPIDNRGGGDNWVVFSTDAVKQCPADAHATPLFHSPTQLAPSP